MLARRQRLSDWVLLSLLILLNACKTTYSGLSQDRSQRVQQALGQIVKNDGQLRAAILANRTFFELIEDPELRAKEGKSYFNLKENLSHWQKSPVFQSQDNKHYVIPRVMRLQVMRPGKRQVTVPVVFDIDDVLRASPLIETLLASVEAGYFNQRSMRLFGLDDADILGVNLFRDSLPNNPSASADPKTKIVEAIGGGAQKLGGIAGHLKEPAFYVLAQHLIGRAADYQGELRFGDVFVLGGLDRTIASGFGIWLSDKPVVVPEQLGLKVYKIGAVSGDGFGSIVEIVKELDDGKSLGWGTKKLSIEAQVDSSPAGRAEDLDTYSGSLYRLSADSLGDIAFIESAHSNYPLTFLPTKKASGFEVAADLRTTEGMRALIAQRKLALGRVGQRTAQLLESVSQEYGQVKALFPKMNYRSFNRLKRAFESYYSTLHVGEVIVELSKIKRFIDSYLVGLMQNNFSSDQRVILERVANNAAKLVLDSDQMVDDLGAVLSSFRFGGMNRAFDEQELKDINRFHNLTRKVPRVGRYGDAPAISSAQIIKRTMGELFETSYFLTQENVDGESNSEAQKFRDTPLSRNLKNILGNKDLEQMLRVLTGFRGDLSGQNKDKKLKDYIQRHCVAILLAMDSIRINSGEIMLPLEKTGQAKASDFDNAPGAGRKLWSKVVLARMEKFLRSTAQINQTLVEVSEHFDRLAR
jgi:hypothetical protein